jgi:hypothetical protein
MMGIFEPGTFVRVLARDRNRGKLGIVVRPRSEDKRPALGEVWIEMAHEDPYGGVFRALYDMRDLRMAEELR